MELTLRAPAKINLSLIVSEKRPDGFHAIDSVMASVDLCDVLTFCDASGSAVRLSCRGIPVPGSDSDNLVLRAANLLRQHSGTDRGASIVLDKHIPAGGGLGGGSSDAAAALLGLNRLWGLDLPTTVLDDLAGQLGSDVAFFLHRPLARCTGRGEQVVALAGSVDLWALLIMPSVHASTAAVYSAYRPDAQVVQAALSQVDADVACADFTALAHRGINSLAVPCLECFGALKQLHDDITALLGCELFVSGSGSTLYTLHADRPTLGRYVEHLHHHGLQAQYHIVGFEAHSPLFQEACCGNY